MASHLRSCVCERLAVPGDVEQRVVGRGADHEDEQDALRLPGQQQHVGLRERTTASTDAQSAVRLVTSTMTGSSGER